MSPTRRRTRRPDPLASTSAVEAVLDSLRSALPDLVPQSKKHLTSLLQAVRGLYARQQEPGRADLAASASGARRGRPPRFTREQLLRVDSTLRVLLSRETNVGVRSFVGQYLPLLDFPPEVREALERGDVNLFEAHQLARLTARRLGCTEAEARSHRRKLLEAHLLRQEPGSRLRERVKEALGELREPDPVQTETLALAKADELLEADPLDSSHLFFEELRRIGRALREIKPEELTDEDVEELMPAVDGVSVALLHLERRRQRRQEAARKLQI
ncbi:MAG TPA: hypothetical protein VGV38_13510 [Pyrinomonadaceae bacterium]|nr:hypothetical protein [Pyrinomonadaceae bacterium]